jgi:hypothetical protein
MSRSLLTVALSALFAQAAPAAAPASIPVRGTPPNLCVNRSFEMTTSGSQRLQFPAPTPIPDGGPHAEAMEWFDCWFSDYSDGGAWYTPEDYEYVWGDTLSAITFIHLEGSPRPLTKLDTFYLCGERDPMGFVATGGVVDFGEIPENEPNYGWILGTFFPVPPIRHRMLDGATRIYWSRQMDCGVPLSGRPDCFSVN